jgi:hypothetical protein
MFILSCRMSLATVLLVRSAYFEDRLGQVIVSSTPTGIPIASGPVSRATCYPEGVHFLTRRSRARVLVSTIDTVPPRAAEYQCSEL